MKTVVMSIIMLASTFAFANNGNGDTKNSETKPTPINSQTVTVQPTSEEKNDDEGLYCKVKIGNREATCWFCDCEKLTKALKDEVKNSD